MPMATRRLARGLAGRSPNGSDYAVQQIPSPPVGGGGGGGRGGGGGSGGVVGGCGDQVRLKTVVDATTVSCNVRRAREAQETNGWESEGGGGGGGCGVRGGDRVRVRGSYRVRGGCGKELVDERGGGGGAARERLSRGRVRDGKHVQQHGLPLRVEQATGRGEHGAGLRGWGNLRAAVDRLCGWRAVRGCRSEHETFREDRPLDSQSILLVQHAGFPRSAPRRRCGSLALPPRPLRRRAQTHPAGRRTRVAPARRERRPGPR